MLEDDYQPEGAWEAKNRFFVLSGCSGAGKSSLLHALGERGFRVVPEAGRQVVREQTTIGGDALPGGNWIQFLELTISRTIHQMIREARSEGFVFFDRSIVDQVNGFRRMELNIPDHLQRAVELFRYNSRVFIVPPWPEIFRNDTERRHSFEAALADYESLLETWRSFGYETVIVPRDSVEARVAFVLSGLTGATTR